MFLYSVNCPKPSGAFYLLPDVSAYYGKSTISGKKITNPDELCLELLREQQVGSYVYTNIYVYNSAILNFLIMAVKLIRLHW